MPFHVVCQLIRAHISWTIDGALRATATARFFLTLFCSASLLAAQGESICIVFTADTEGHVGPCRECPFHPGLGGSSRRARALAQLRKEEPKLLLIDAAAPCSA